MAINSILSSKGGSATNLPSAVTQSSKVMGGDLMRAQSITSQDFGGTHSFANPSPVSGQGGGRAKIEFLGQSSLPPPGREGKEGDGVSGSSTIGATGSVSASALDSLRAEDDDDDDDDDGGSGARGGKG